MILNKSAHKVMEHKMKVSLWLNSSTDVADIKRNNTCFIYVTLH